MHKKRDGGRVTFARHRIVRVYEQDDEGETKPNSVHDRMEPLPDAGYETIGPNDIMKKMRHVVRAFYSYLARAFSHSVFRCQRPVQAGQRGRAVCGADATLPILR